MCSWVYPYIIGLAVDEVHLGLKLRFFFFCDGRLVVVIIEEHRKHVGHGLALGVAHGVHGGVGTFGHELVLQQVAAAVASDDAAHFPKADVIEEFTAGDANLAHEQLVDVVGGT